ncbi:2-dehydro-3-deoxygalactonokinase [Roseibium suaedae]|uniref:2-keto-3-deoxygalactonate kinase n=1 Tax=Roseibium suaedae TaxID=735517 RepID=A0A1M7NRK1_9HYPH|nr:2-dehydro-3-deoxygalactonokinase [Roseibium suaedae]SHN06509.1 2-keto-3-deoxygalactonate kinase [Roseibium suaedae]
MEFIGVDWGSTRFRAWALLDDGQIASGVESDLGLKSVADGNFSGALTETCGEMLTGAPGMPILLSGMVGSRTGWKEAPYCACPASIEDVTAAAIRFDIAGHPAAILPGATCVDGNGHADVMRGEEIQIFGAADMLGLKDATICIPGTHAKWASLVGGLLTGFQTHVTGELFALLRGHSLVGQLADGDDEDLDAFRRGIDHGMKKAAAHAVFAARADALQGKLAPKAVSAFLSGVLIGNELAARPQGGMGATILLATGVLAERYAVALEHVGEQFVVVDAKEAARAGQMLAAKTLWQHAAANGEGA